MPLYSEIEAEEKNLAEIAAKYGQHVADGFRRTAALPLSLVNKRFRDLEKRLDRGLGITAPPHKRKGSGLGRKARNRQGSRWLKGNRRRRQDEGGAE